MRTHALRSYANRGRRALAARHHHVPLLELEENLPLVQPVAVSRFSFFRRVEIGAWQRQKKAPRERNCISEDRDSGVCDMLTPI
jgi:hypothetical protein